MPSISSRPPFPPRPDETGQATRPQEQATNAANETASPVGSLSNHTVQPYEAGMPLGGLLAGQIDAASRALEAAASRLNAPEETPRQGQAGKRPLSRRNVALDGPQPAMNRARNLAIRMAASPTADGPLFHAVLDQSRYSGDLISDRQRGEIASLVQDVCLADLPPEHAELFTRAALRAAADHVLAGRADAAEGRGADAVAKGIADCAIEHAVAAHKHGNTAEAAGWLVDGALAIDGARGFAAASALDVKKEVSEVLLSTTEGAAPGSAESAARDISLMLDDIHVWAEAKLRLAGPAQT